MNNPSKNRFGKLLLVLVVSGAVLWAIWQRQAIVDYWRLQSFQPSADIAALAESTTMQGKGKTTFYSSQPVILDKEQFNQQCDNNDEQSIVLGCYAQQSIYLYNVTDERLDGVEEVTAAHEMLHAAYERLSDSERKRIDALLQPQIAALTDPRLLGLIDLYNKQEPGQLYNEMHSILATELRELSPELEDYYRQYFADRKKVVSYSERYEAIFSGSKARIEAMDRQLADLKQQIDQGNASLDSQKAQLDSEYTHLQTLRNAEDPARYNAAADAYNKKVETFNALVETVKAQVAQHNQIVEVRNQEVAAQNNLYQSLNSRYQPE